MATRHFLTLFDLSVDELTALIARAIELKKMHAAGKQHTPLQNKMLALMFDKSSTRTRVSFETGMTQLGGNSMFLSPGDTQLGRGRLKILPGLFHAWSMRLLFAPTNTRI